MKYCENQPSSLANVLRDTKMLRNLNRIELAQFYKSCNGKNQDSIKLPVLENTIA